MPRIQNASLFRRLLLLFTVVPVVDLALLVWLGGRIGFWPTAGMIVGTALLGSYLAQREGLSALARFRGSLAAGEMPGDALTDGIIVLIAGALLIAPGVLTDLTGILGLFPPTRRLVKRAVLKRVKRGAFGGAFGGGSVRVATWGATPGFTPPGSGPPPDDGVVDVEYEEVKRES